MSKKSKKPEPQSKISKMPVSDLERFAVDQLVKDFLDRAFGGSAQKLLIQALSAGKTSRKDLAELRRLLDELEGKSS